MNISIPLYRPVALTTLSTTVRVVDTAVEANTMSCVTFDITKYDRSGWYYDLFLWLPAALAVGLWAISWTARFMAGWVVGSGVAEYGTKEQKAARTKSLDKAGRREAKMRKWGTMIVSGISGERLSVSSALLRFGTLHLPSPATCENLFYPLTLCSDSWTEGYPASSTILHDPGYDSGTMARVQL